MTGCALHLSYPAVHNDHSPSCCQGHPIPAVWEELFGAKVLDFGAHADAGSFRAHTLIIGEPLLHAVPYTHFPEGDFFLPYRASAAAFVPWILRKFKASYGQPPDYVVAEGDVLNAGADERQRRRLIATCIVRLDSDCRRIINMDEVVSRFVAWNITASVHSLDGMSLAEQVRTNTFFFE